MKTVSSHLALLLCAFGLQAQTPPMQITHDVTVSAMVSDQFTWYDSNGQPRVAVLAHNDGQVGPQGARGGALTQFQYQLPGNVTRTAGVTTYPNAGYGGFGYVVSHSSRYVGCADGGDSPLGGFLAGKGFQRVFEGRHHAIFRFTQDYPRNCPTIGPVITRYVPVTIDWVFSTGRDNPLWAITYDVDQIAEPGQPPVLAGMYFDDSRAPYGELNIDGEANDPIDGTAWGDRYKFTSVDPPPVTLDSAWTWNVTNTVPYVKEWLNGPLTQTNTHDATMGIVQTQIMTQQDAGGGRDAGVGTDITQFWNKTSANGNACAALVHVMPCPDDWPYQANGDSLFGGSSNNARLTWKTQYGFIGQPTYAANDGTGATPPGYPKKSYSTYIVLGTHSSAPVEAQVTQVETVQSLTLSAATGSVVTSGPAGITRADNVPYAPPGYNHIYGALAFLASGNQLDANVAVGSGTLRKPLIIVSNYTAGDPQAKFAGVSLVADVDYFASLRPAASELWITLNFNLVGATNHIEILGAGAPGIPTGVVATALTSTRVDIAWNAIAGATYQIDRKSPGGGFIQIATPANNSYSDMSAAADTAYLYRVRAVTGAGTSGDSAPDLATTVIFTDSPLTGVVVKAEHLSQLRTATDAVRTLAGLGLAGFTDAATAGTTIKALHVTELRSQLDPARAALGLSTPAYTDGALAGVVVKAVHFQELRDRVQ